MRVYYEGEVWNAKLYVGRKLFECVKKNMPSLIVEITQVVSFTKIRGEIEITRNIRKDVKIKELKLYDNDSDK